MFCSKCGAVVNGKYCSCCGTKVRSELEEYRRAERRMRKEFVDSCAGTGRDWSPARHHLAEACWLASYMEYDKSRDFAVGDRIPQSVFDNLQTVRDYATQIFNCVSKFLRT